MYQGLAQKGATLITTARGRVERTTGEPWEVTREKILKRLEEEADYVAFDLLAAYEWWKKNPDQRPGFITIPIEPQRP